MKAIPRRAFAKVNTFGALVACAVWPTVGKGT